MYFIFYLLFQIDIFHILRNLQNISKFVDVIDLRKALFQVIAFCN